MDDINQKVNAIKMSLQTVDYRLGKQDEIALQTAETLAHIQQLSKLQQLQMQVQLQALVQRPTPISQERDVDSLDIPNECATYMCESQTFAGLSPCSIGSTSSNNGIGIGLFSVDTTNCVPISAPVR